MGSELYVTKPFTREELLDAIEQHAPNGRAVAEEELNDPAAEFV